MGTKVEDVFRDFKGRRDGLIKALTTDLDELIRLCLPGTLNYLLYGFPNATWEVVNWSSYRAMSLPPEIPQPVFGITFDGEMDRKQWLSFMAAHSDAWLMNVAIFLGERQGLGREALARLFEMINDLPTVSEVVIGGGRKPKKDETPKSSTESNRLSPKPESESPKLAPPEENEGVEGEGENTLCGACGNKSFDEFWICCDVCGTWYHGSCVGITPAAAKEFSKYQCPSCSNKRQRH